MLNKFNTVIELGKKAPFTVVTKLNKEKYSEFIHDVSPTVVPVLGDTINNMVVKPAVKSIDESRTEIFAMFNDNSRGGFIWSSLKNTEKKAMCMIAGITLFDLNKPLSDVNQFDRHKLFIAIQAFSQTIKKFDSVSLPDFK